MNVSVETGLSEREEIALKPCPFCGGEADAIRAVGETWVRCMSCETSGPSSSNETYAITAWNTRAEAAPLSDVMVQDSVNAAHLGMALTPVQAAAAYAYEIGWRDRHNQDARRSPLREEVEKQELSSYSAPVIGRSGSLLTEGRDVNQRAWDLCDGTEGTVFTDEFSEHYRVPKSLWDALAEAVARYDMAGWDSFLPPETTGLSDAQLEAMARAADAEESAQRGEPSPWRADIAGNDPEFRAERIAAMRCAVSALSGTLPPLREEVERLLEFLGRQIELAFVDGAYTERSYKDVAERSERQAWAMTERRAHVLETARAALSTPLEGGGEQNSSSSQGNLPSPPADTEAATGWVPTHRHVKRGSLYRLVSSAVMQCEGPVVDEEFLALYQGEDGLYWVRPADEFKDGRFEALPVPPEGQQP